MTEEDVNRLIQEALECGRRTYTEKTMGPYYQTFGYGDDPFRFPQVFIAPSQKPVVEKISKFIGSSKNRINYNIAIIGPKWIGKTTLLEKIHQNAKILKYNGYFVIENYFLEKTGCRKIDNEVFYESFFEKFLDEMTKKTHYIIIDQNDHLGDQVFYYIKEIRKQTEFTSLIVTLFDVISWNLLPISCQEIFEKTFFLCPITIEESKSFLLNYLKAPNQDRKNPFTQAAIDKLAESCYGSPGLLVYIARESMRFAHLIQEDSITEQVVRQVANDNFFRGAKVLSNAKKSFEKSSRKNIIKCMLTYKKPLTATQIAEKMTLSRQTICYHLGEMLKEDIVSKIPKRGRETPYQITLPSHIVFEHRMLRRCLNEGKKG